MAPHATGRKTALNSADNIELFRSPYVNRAGRGLSAQKHGDPGDSEAQYIAQVMARVGDQGQRLAREAMPGFNGHEGDIEGDA